MKRKYKVRVAESRTNGFWTVFIERKEFGSEVLMPLGDFSLFDKASIVAGFIQEALADSEQRGLVMAYERMIDRYES